jgi:hypothetical protein
MVSNPLSRRHFEGNHWRRLGNPLYFCCIFSERLGIQGYSPPLTSPGLAGCCGDG